jgi:ABC-2 type transport system permease protein
VTINGQLRSLDGIRALIVAKPDSLFTEQDKFVIDQFVMRGGRVLWLLDNVHASMDSLQKGLTVGLPMSVNLDDQLFKYGVRVNANLVQDIQAAAIPIITGYVGNQPQQNLFPWFYFPLAVSDSKHPIVNNLNAVKFEFANTLDTVGNKNITKTVLLHTSKYTKVQNAPVRISLSIVQHEPNPQQFQKSNQPLAVLLEGKFESVFKNRLPADLVNNKDIGFVGEGAPNKMIVVGDGDVIRNDIQRSTGNIFPLGIDRYTGQEYGNKNFILNCMNYLCDESGLISVRSRNVQLRMLDKTKVETEGLTWKTINVIGPILIIIVFGTIQFLIRKKSFTK